jgi:hypothetical protein
VFTGIKYRDFLRQGPYVLLQEIIKDCLGKCFEGTESVYSCKPDHRHNNYMDRWLIKMHPSFCYEVMGKNGIEFIKDNAKVKEITTAYHKRRKLCSSRKRKQLKRKY